MSGERGSGESAAESAAALQREWNDLLQETLCSVLRGLADAAPRSAAPAEQQQQQQRLSGAALSVPATLQCFARRVLAVHARGAPHDALLDAESHFAVLSTSLAQYLRALLPHDAARALSLQLRAECVSWLADLLHFAARCPALLESDVLHARASVFRASRLTSNSVVYATALGKRYVDVERLLGIHGMAGVSVREASYPLWSVDELVQWIDEDIAHDRLPRLLIATCGLRETGASDDVARLREVCNKYGMWLHVEGPALALLGAHDEIKAVSAVRSADSVTLCVGQLFHVPFSEALTLFPRAEAASAASVHALFPSAVLDALPLWLFMQHSGSDKLRASIDTLFASASIMREALEPVAGVCVRCVDELPHVVLLRLEPPNAPARICDQVTLQLYQRLSRDVHELGMDVVQTGGSAWLRFDPLLAPICAVSPDSMHSFAAHVRISCETLVAFPHAREVFDQAIRHFDCLRIEPCTDFYGLCCVRYVPVYFQRGQLVDSSVSGVDQLNVKLGQRLQGMRRLSIFSVETADDGHPCIGIGIDISAPLTVSRAKQLLALVKESGSELEDSLNVLDEIGEVIREAQARASSELAREKAKAESDRGLMRRIPIVGSVWNWWRPQAAAPVHGRRFDIVTRELGEALEPASAASTAASTPQAPAAAASHADSENEDM